MEPLASVDYDHSAEVKKLFCFSASDLNHFKALRLLQRKTHSIDQTYE